MIELTAIYAAPEAAETKDTSAVSSKADWQTMKDEQARLRKKQNELKKTEGRINELEEKNNALSEEMNNPDIASDVGKLMEITKEIEAVNSELEKLYELWETLV